MGYKREEKKRGKGYYTGLDRVELSKSLERREWNGGTMSGLEEGWRGTSREPIKWGECRIIHVFTLF